MMLKKKLRQITIQSVLITVFVEKILDLFRFYDVVACVSYYMKLSGLILLENTLKES